MLTDSELINQPKIDLKTQNSVRKLLILIRKKSFLTVT